MIITICKHYDLMHKKKDFPEFLLKVYVAYYSLLISCAAGRKSIG